MSPNKRSTSNLLRRYLNGALTAPEEAELERRALTDESLAEAMRGLRTHPETDHEARVARMLQGARSQVQGEVEGARVRTLPRNYARFAAAASIVLLFVACSLWFLPQWIEMDPGDMAMKTRSEAPVSAETTYTDEAQPEYDLTADEEPTSPEPQTEATSIAPPSSTPNLRPRPATEPAPPAAVKQEAEALARKRLVKKDRQDQSARIAPGAESRIAAAQTHDQVAADISVVEEVSVEMAPPAAVPVAIAPMTAPVPSASRDATSGMFEQEESAAAGAENKRGNYLEGRITNENGVPILSALVRLPGLPIGERTDSSGYFRLPADAATTRIEVSHPDYEDEMVDLRGLPESFQVSLDRKEWQPERPGMIQNAASSTIILDNKPGYAAPLEGYGTLRKRLETGKPESIPKGKVKFSFTVNTDGTLTDFEFRGQPDRATMDYIGETLVQTSIWEIMQGEDPVRVYMKVVFQ